MARALLSLLTVGVMIYALVDCWRSLPTEVQRLTRAGWTVVIVLIPLLGAIAYLVAGRVPPSAAAGPAARPRVLAPDDDPEFLRSLDLQRRQHAAEEKRRQAAEERRRKADQKAEQKAEKAERKAERKGDERRSPRPPGSTSGSGAPSDSGPDDAEPNPGTDEGDDHSGQPTA